MNIIVVGCGRVGAELAMRLTRQGHRVAVIDYQPEAFNKLPADFTGRIIEGDALNRYVLQRAGIEKADGISVVKSSDSTNVVVAHLARKKFGINNIVVLNYEPQNRPLYEAFDLQVVSSALWGARRIEELLYHKDIRPLYSAGNGEVEIFEFTVPPSWNGRTIADLLPEQGCLLTALTRSGKALIPDPGMTLMSGDVLMVSATIDGISVLRQKMKERQEV